MRINELDDEDILNFLMTSDFEDNYSPTELKYLLTKWRYFHRHFQGISNREKLALEGELAHTKDMLSDKENQILNLQVDLANKQNEVDFIKSRKITLRDWWRGKIIIENEN
jgi:hypothetical protein